MSGQLQLRRGSTAENDAFTGVEGELTYDTVKKELRIHDGTKQGGFEVPVLVAVQRPTAENNYTWYRKWSDGWVEQGGYYLRDSFDQSWWTTIALPVEMNTFNYHILLSGHWMNGDKWGTFGLNSENRTPTTFEIWFYAGSSQDGIKGVMWRAEGMAAE